MRDNWSYRAAFTRRNRRRNPAFGDSPMTTAADPQIVPRQPAAAMRPLQSLEGPPAQEHLVARLRELGIAA